MLALSVWFNPTPSRAAEPVCGAASPWVSMEPSGLSHRFAVQLVGDLRAGLAPSRIDVCLDASSAPKAPLARVIISRSRAGSQQFSIDVSDSVTQKRIGRDVDLAHIPADGRPFALAVAAEELLRASWAELALAREKPEPKPTPAPAPVVSPPRAEAFVDSEATPAAPRFDALALRMSFEHYTGGQTHLGGDLAFRQTLLPRLSFSLAVGARRALPADAPSGTVSADALGAEMALLPTLWSSAMLRLEALVGVRGARIWYRAESVGDATSHARNSYAFYGRAGLAATLGYSGSLSWLTVLGVGGPLRSFSAAEGDRTVTGVSGLELFASSGAALEF